MFYFFSNKFFPSDSDYNRRHPAGPGHGAGGQAVAQRDAPQRIPLHDGLLRHHPAGADRQPVQQGLFRRF